MGKANTSRKFLTPDNCSFMQAEKYKMSFGSRFSKEQMVGLTTVPTPRSHPSYSHHTSSSYSRVILQTVINMHYIVLDL